ncbi:MAG: hypothetical protein R3E86_03860 [Pseudomonadales bacterium]
MSTFPATPGAKTMYLIRRRAHASREELVAHWFANHMPLVIEAQHKAANAGRLHARRYIATLFDPDADGRHPWDGVAQLWWERVLPRPEQPHGTHPTDSFQEVAEPYVPWPTTEYVVMDGSEHLPVRPLTLNPPFPCTRSGFCKVTYLVKAKADADHGALFDHWLNVHASNVRALMAQTGGFRYLVSHSIEPGLDAFAGMAELYFKDRSGWEAFRARQQADGMERWVDIDGTLCLTAQTELIGIP